MEIRRRFEQFINAHLFLPVLLVLLPFVVITLPLCFQNIGYLNLLLAFHIDSGSIISSVFTVVDSAQFYNQNVGYHTAYYGFPYNSILILVFEIYRHFLHLDTITNFYIFALTARLFSLFIAGVALLSFYYLSIKVLKNTIVAFLLTILLAMFYDFIFYSTLIKGDILALLFSIGSFYFLFKYIEEKETLFFQLGSLLGALAVFTKQPYIFMAVPLFLGYFFHFDKMPKMTLAFVRESIIVFFKTFLIVLISYFIIHPYAFIQFDTYIEKQNDLKQMVSAPFIENVAYWVYVYLDNTLVLIGILTTILYLIFFIFLKKKNPNAKVLFLMSVFNLLYALWLTASVGPIRVTTYLLPIYPFLLLVSTVLIQRVFLLGNKGIARYFLIVTKIMVITGVIYVFINNAIRMTAKINNFMTLSRDFSHTPQVISISSFIRDPLFDKRLKTLRLVYTVSLPIPDGEFKELTNNWQFGSKSEDVIKNITTYNPDVLLIDTTQWYERPVQWWRKLAHDINLKREKIYYHKNGTAQIILFYR